MLDEQDITAEQLILQKLDRILEQQEELLAFKRQAEETFGAMQEAIKGNPMLSMMLGK
jgi:hypothetical protein